MTLENSTCIRDRICKTTCYFNEAIDLKDRQLIPELMDDPSLDSEMHRDALRGLERLNRWTGNAQVAWRPILQLARSAQLDRISVFDLATGSGDLLVGLHRLSEQANLELALEAGDLSPTALQVARETMERNQLEIPLHCFDAVSDPVPGHYDVVLCTTFLHHLADSEAVQVLRAMAEASRKLVVVVDLSRSRLNWSMVWLASRLLSRSPIVHFDGPQSVRAAFTPKEISQLAIQAGLKNVRVTSRWPCRFVLTGNPAL